MSDSLGFKTVPGVNLLEYKDTIIKIIQKDLLANWKNILFSNVQLIEFDSGEVSEDGSVVVTYMLKLDPRIAKNTSTITKLVDYINATLTFNETLIYSNLTTNYSAIISFALPFAQITSEYFKYFFFRLNH